MSLLMFVRLLAWNFICAIALSSSIFERRKSMMIFSLCFDALRTACSIVRAPLLIGLFISHGKPFMIKSGCLDPGDFEGGMSSMLYPISVKYTIVSFSCFSRDTPFGVMVPRFIC